MVVGTFTKDVSRYFMNTLYIYIPSTCDLANALLLYIAETRRVKADLNTKSLAGKLLSQHAHTDIT